jgi:hypothetical protein
MTPSEVEELTIALRRLRAEHAHALAAKDKEIAALKDEAQLLRFAVKGVCAEYITIRVEASPGMMHSETVDDFIRMVSENATRSLSRTIEERLGGMHKLHKENAAMQAYAHYLQRRLAERGCGYRTLEEFVAARYL